MTAQAPRAQDLAVVIVSWNTRDLLARCLASLARDPGLTIGAGPAGARRPGPRRAAKRPLVTEVTVVDNASTDGSGTMVRARFPWARLVQNQHNLGFAAANNQALRQARGRYLLLLNPDTEIVEGALAGLWQVLEAYPQAGIAGGQLFNGDGSPQRSCGIFPSLWTELLLATRYLGPVRRRVQVRTPEGELAVESVDWVSGACLMIRRQAFQAIGPLDERFWLYTEEADWCYRARAAGWEVLSVPQARVYHQARAASRQRYVATMLCFYQSRVRFVYKHRGPFHASLMRGVLRAKAAVWYRRPGRSPLREAYPGLPDEQIASAYLRLVGSLALPLVDYLARDWSSGEGRETPVLASAG